MRGQLKMGETIVVLIIFFFLLVFGLVFYASVSKGSSREEGEKRTAMEAVQITQRVESLPELQCTSSGNTDYDCIDLYKMEALSRTASEHPGIYGKLMPNTRIRASQAFPEVKEWVVYNNTLSNSSGILFSIPTTFYDSVADTFSFGLLIIEVYR
jgi:hypothetical protein